MSEVQSDNPENETSGNWRFASYRIPYGNCPSSRCTTHTYMCARLRFPRLISPDVDSIGTNRNAYLYSGFLFGGSKPHIPRIGVRPRMLPGHMGVSWGCHYVQVSWLHACLCVRTLGIRLAGLLYRVLCIIISFLSIYTPPRHMVSMVSIGRADNIIPGGNWRTKVVQSSMAYSNASSGNLDNGPTKRFADPQRINEKSGGGRHRLIII